VPTPVNAALAEMVREVEEGKRRVDPDNLAEFEGELT
jgi:hypothetical protein